MDGKTRTDAGYFTKRGVESVQNWYPNPTWWALQPRAVRALIRLCTLFGSVTLTALWVADRAVFYGVVGIIGGCLLLWGLWAGWERIVHFRERKHTVIPFIEAAAPIVDQPIRQIERTIQFSPERVRLEVPAHFNPHDAELTRLTSLANRRLTGEWKVATQVRRLPYYVELSKQPEPRKAFNYDEFVPLVLKQKPGDVILGMGVHDELVTADIYNMYPMAALSMGTGAGKSSFLRTFIAQEYYHGVRDWLICDVKMISLAGIEVLPGINICRTPQEIRKAIHELRLEMDTRYQDLLMHPEMTFPRKYLILEEQNAFAILTQDDWEESGGKKKDRVWNDIKVLIVMARQVGIHIIGAYQLLTALVSGGDSTIRTMMNLKILCRYSPQAWDMLVGERPREPSSNHPGRAVAVMGEGTRKRFQIPLLTMENALELATMEKP
jgi:hypothetical protein